MPSRCVDCGETDPGRFYKDRPYQCKTCHTNKYAPAVAARPRLDGSTAQMTDEEFWGQTKETQRCRYGSSTK
jgi:hypothetical protein